MAHRENSGSTQFIYLEEEPPWPTTAGETLRPSPRIRVSRAYEDLYVNGWMSCSARLFTSVDGLKFGPAVDGLMAGADRKALHDGVATFDDLRILAFDDTAYGSMWFKIVFQIDCAVAGLTLFSKEVITSEFQIRQPPSWSDKRTLSATAKSTPVKRGRFHPAIIPVGEDATKFEALAEKWSPSSAKAPVPSLANPSLQSIGDVAKDSNVHAAALSGLGTLDPDLENASASVSAVLSDLNSTILSNVGGQLDSKGLFHMDFLERGGVGDSLSAVSQRVGLVLNGFPDTPGSASAAEPLSQPPSSPTPGKSDNKPYFKDRRSNTKINVTHLLSLPQHEAAARLNLSKATFSKRFSQANGGRRWPYRKIQTFDKKIAHLKSQPLPNLEVIEELQRKRTEVWQGEAWVFLPHHHG